MGDLRDLLSIFGNLEALTSSAFHRILESYALAIKKLQHEKILAVEHVKKRDTTTIHKLDAGPEISEYICEHCKFDGSSRKRRASVSRAARLATACTS